MLQDQNFVLRQKLDCAEATIQTLKQDLDIARKALGPWWRMDESSSRRSSREEVTSDSASFISQQQLSNEQARRPTSDSISPAITFSPDAPSFSTQDTDSYNATSASALSDPAFLAPFFPPASGSGDRTNTPPQPNTPNTAQLPNLPDPSMRHIFPLARGVFSSPYRFSDVSSQGVRAPPLAPPPPHSSPSRIPPIDFSTTLEGALSGIRNSVVALSASLDALGRRQDIALTTENLRMNEEVGALRAVIHGLRMQVHTLITERNGHPWVPTTTTPSNVSYYNQTSQPHLTQVPVVINSTTSTTKL